MSTIRVSRKHSLTKEEARAEAQALAEDLGRQFNVDYEWKGDRLEFKRSGVKGHLQVEDSRVDVELTLGLLARPFKGRIEQELNTHLNRLVKA